MNGYWGDWMWGWSFVGMLWMLFFWGLIIGGIVLLVRWIADGGRRRTDGGAGGAGTAPAAETAMDILKKRYARGEISKDEFDRMKEDLGQ